MAALGRGDALADRAAGRADGPGMTRPEPDATA
jgi:hypothetical protein